jgi:hypothetical protein
MPAVGKKMVSIMAIEDDSYRSVRVFRNHQTEIYAPKEADQTPHNHALVHRDKREIYKGY